MIGDGFTRFANPVSVLLVKQAVSLKPKLEPVSDSTNGSRDINYCTVARQLLIALDQSSIDQVAVVQLVEYRTRIAERLRVRLTPGPLQATLSKLLTYCVLRPTQPPTLSRTGNEYSSYGYTG